MDLSRAATSLKFHLPVGQQSLVNRVEIVDMYVLTLVKFVAEPLQYFHM